MGLSLVTLPYAEPLSLDDVKGHLRIDSDTEDSYLRALTIAAREWVENHTQRQYCTATWELTLDGFPLSRIIDLPRPPLVSVVWVKYYDADDQLQTLDASAYRVHTSTAGGYIAVKANATIPSTSYREDAVVIRFTAGYGFQEDVPEIVKVAMKMLVGEWYQNREATIKGTIISEVPIGVSRLLESYRVKGFI